jgi:hypothetical protein
VPSSGVGVIGDSNNTLKSGTILFLMHHYPRVRSRNSVLFLVAAEGCAVSM